MIRPAVRARLRTLTRNACRARARGAIREALDLESARDAVLATLRGDEKTEAEDLVLALEISAQFD